jgi:cell division protein FtsQ
MFKVKKHRRRRSEVRLGAQAVSYEATAFQPHFTVTPVLNFWQTRGVKLSSFLILGLFGGLLYLLFSRPLFFVRTAEIRGNIAVSAREIYTISGIDRQSIFWVNPGEVTKKIMTLPNIKAASVSLTLPAQVVIEVSERHPELVWQTGQTLWWIDQEGTVVPPKEDLTGMLRIIDDDRQPLEPGYQIDSNIVQGAQTLRVLAPDVSVIRYSRLRGLTVATPEGWPVYMGSGSEIKAKLVVLTSVLADLKERNIEPAYIDLRDPLRPVYKPASVIQIGQPAVSPAKPVLLPRSTPRPQ